LGSDDEDETEEDQKVREEDDGNQQNQGNACGNDASAKGVKSSSRKGAASKNKTSSTATQFDFGDGKLDIVEQNLANEVFDEGTRKRIRNLPQTQKEIWQVVVRRLRVWSGASEGEREDGSPQPCRPYSVIISCLYPEGRLLAQDICDPPEKPPAPTQVLNLLSRACLNPTIGAQRRPKSITFSDSGLAGALYRTMETFNIEVSQLSESEGIDEVVAKFSQLLVNKEIATVGPTSERPGLLQTLGVAATPVIRATYAAASQVAQDAPWREWHERRIFELTVEHPADWQPDARASSSTYTRIEPNTVWLSLIGHDLGGTYGFAVFYSRLDAEARLVPEGQSLYTKFAEDEEARCSYTGQTELELGHPLKRTKPRKVDIRTGKELQYADANALRSHWPSVRKFALPLDEVEAGRKNKRQHWVGREATVLFEDATLIPFDDLSNIESEHFAIASKIQAPALGDQRYPVYLLFKNGEPVDPDMDALVWLERAALVAKALHSSGEYKLSPPFQTKLKVATSSLKGGLEEEIIIKSAPIFLESEARAAMQARMTSSNMDANVEKDTNSEFGDNLDAEFNNNEDNVEATLPGNGNVINRSSPQSPVTSVLSVTNTSAAAVESAAKTQSKEQKNEDDDTAPVESSSKCCVM